MTQRGGSLQNFSENTAGLSIARAQTYHGLPEARLNGEAVSVGARGILGKPLKINGLVDWPG
jgi:hypothetical protein